MTERTGCNELKAIYYIGNTVRYISAHYDSKEDEFEGKVAFYDVHDENGDCLTLDFPYPVDKGIPSYASVASDPIFGNGLDLEPSSDPSDSEEASEPSDEETYDYEHDYQVGDKFVVVGEDEWVEKGAIVELYNDDGTIRPGFMVFAKDAKKVDPEHRERHPEHQIHLYLYWKDLEPVK